MNIFQQLTSRVGQIVDPDGIVPHTGFTVVLTSLAAAAMGFLAVFTLALSLAAARMADHWATDLARMSTIRISAPADQIQSQIDAVQKVLEVTPGVVSNRVITVDEQAKLLEPWLGPNLPLGTLPIPRLIEVQEDGAQFDPEGLRFRLAAEAPGAVLDDHRRWRAPLVDAARRLQTLGDLALLLIGAAMAVMITLAAQAALAANMQVISVLRLVGARDAYIARAFVRRFTVRAISGGLMGVLLALLTLQSLPEMSDTQTLFTQIGFLGWDWIWVLMVPLLAGGIAFGATRWAALRRLRRIA
jgi:cell division transport system permease protein